MKEEMERLISLQRIDSEIARIAHDIARCEEEVAKREQAVREQKDKLEALRAKIERMTEKQRENQNEHDDALARIKDAQNRMLLVQTPREHQALLKGIEDCKKIAKDADERALQFIEQLEQLEAEAAELETGCAAEAGTVDEARQKAAKEIKKLTAEKKKAETERTERVKTVDPAAMQRYNKLLAKRGGLAVTAVLNSVCQGCHMTLPPQQVNEVMQGDKLNLCPTCQRILYYQPPAEDEERPAEEPEEMPEEQTEDQPEGTQEPPPEEEQLADDEA